VDPRVGGPTWGAAELPVAAVGVVVDDEQAA